MQYKTPFLPIMPGSVTATYLDLDSAAEAIVKGRTAAVFVEPIQGEGGVTPANTCASSKQIRAPVVTHTGPHGYIVSCGASLSTGCI